MVVAAARSNSINQQYRRTVTVLLILGLTFAFCYIVWSIRLIHGGHNTVEFSSWSPSSSWSPPQQPRTTTLPAASVVVKPQRHRDEIRFEIFRKHKAAFVHVPKSGGSSFERMLYGKGTPSNHQRANKFRKMHPSEWENDMLKIALVRNPYQRVYSAYRYLHDGGNGKPMDRPKMDIVKRDGDTFRDFVNKSLAKHVASSDELIFFMPQTWYFLHDETGEILVNIIVKLEEVHPAVTALGDLIDPGLLKEPMPWMRKGKANDKHTLCELLDEETADKIYTLYADEFETLGYRKVSWRCPASSETTSTAAQQKQNVDPIRLTIKPGSPGKNRKDCDSSLGAVSLDDVLRHSMTKSGMAGVQPVRTLLGRDIIRRNHNRQRNSNNDSSSSKTKLLSSEDDPIPLKFRRYAKTAAERVVERLRPGDDIQESIDRLTLLEGGGTVVLSAGTFVLTEPLILRNSVHIAGAGNGDYFADVSKLSTYNRMTVGILNGTSQPGETLVTCPLNANWPLFTNLDRDELDQIRRGTIDHGAAEGRALINVRLSDFRIYGGINDNDGNIPLPVYYHEHDHPLHNTSDRAMYRASGNNDLLGVFVTSTAERGLVNNFHMHRLTITHCAMGIQVRGAWKSSVMDSAIYGNGGIAEHWHNVYYRRSTDVRILRNILSNSPAGNGLNMFEVTGKTLVSGNLIIGNHFRGFRADKCGSKHDFQVHNNVIVGNGETGMRLTGGCGGNNDYTDNFVWDNGRIFHPQDFEIGVNARIAYDDGQCYIT